MRQQILSLKKIVRHNTTLIRRARKAKSFKKVIEIQDQWVKETKKFDQLINEGLF